MSAKFRLAPPLALLLSMGCAPVPGANTQATPTPAATVMPSMAPSQAPAPSASPIASTFDVTGKVLDDEIAGVSGATITAHSAGQPDVTALTSGDGSYALKLPAGTFDLTASKAGWTHRTQSVTLAGAMVVNFGAQTSLGVDPYFLSNNPEIERVDVKEDAPGGPLTLGLVMSEPLTKESQQSFEYLFQLDAGTSTAFVRASGGSSEYNLKSENSWDADGKVFTFKYKFPYLASGDTEVTYSARLRQNQLTTKDAVTREFDWDDLHIVDAIGKSLGKNRAQYAFLAPKLFTLAPELLTDFKYGYYTDQRRWNLTHQPTFRFTAAKDTKAPSLQSVSVSKKEKIGTGEADILALHFDKAMRVAKDKDNPTYTRLDKDKALVVINVSKFKSGSNPTPLSASNKPRLIEFSRTDDNVVYLHYPSGTFETFEWVEVTLDRDFLDPVGNRPDPAHSKLTGSIN